MFWRGRKIWYLMLCPDTRTPESKEGSSSMRQFKIVVEKHPDTYVAYPLGLKGVVVGQGETYEAALAEVKSAIQFHVETFGAEAFGMEGQ